MGIKNCEVRFGKKNELGNGIGSPFRNLYLIFEFYHDITAPSCYKIKLI